MKLITTIPYDETKFKHISNHYDLHLKGTCIYNNELCAFKAIKGDWNDELDNWDESFCQIYSLTKIEKYVEIKEQRKFELMVGYHWSYPQRKEGVGFYIRKPKWLYKILFKMYYNLKKRKHT